MTALEIQDIKLMMSGMLSGKLFDKFYLRDGEIQTFAQFTMGGCLNRPYFDDDEWEQLEGREYPLWAEVRPFAYQLIRGKKLPVQFHFVFQLSRENIRWFLEHHHLNTAGNPVGGLFMNINYDHQRLICTSGISYQMFTMDKTAERCWDETVEQFFRQNHIAFQQL